MPSQDACVAVRQVWQIALPEGTRLAGGERGLDRHVEWVAPLRAAYPLFGSLGRGYLALARLELARQLDGRITPSYLLHELHRMDASALVVDESLPPEHGDLADALGLPLLCLPPDADLHQVERDILRTLVDHESQSARREMEIRQRLLRTCGQGGLEALVQELARLMEGEVLVLDAGKIVIQRAGHTAKASPAVLKTYPIRVAGRLLGELSLSPRANNHLLDIYSRQASEVCGIEMLERVTRQETEERLGADLIHQLLDEGCDEEAIVARLARLGYPADASQSHAVVALGLGADARSEPSPRDAAKRIRWAAERDGARVLTAHHGRYLLLLASSESAAPERLLRRWVEAGHPPGAERGCEAGVSRTVRGIVGLRAAVRQAIDALELGRRIAGRDGPHYYEELGLYRLLADLRGRDELKRFYEETIAPLARYDAAHGMDLLYTLEVFFRENTNASQAARALYVHRNTLNYRLQRIVEISGLDLGDPEARLAMQLALKVHHLALI